jgi:hypothetical protein
VRTHGEALAAAILASPAHRLIYRPHPRSGVVDPEYGAANQRIIAAITAANAADASANHVYDDGPDLGWQLAAADLAVVDISAMVYDRLAADRPLLVTRPVDPEALVDTHGYLSDAEWLSAAASERFLEEANRVLSDPDASRARGVGAALFRRHRSRRGDRTLRGRHRHAHGALGRVALHGIRRRGR